MLKDKIENLRYSHQYKMEAHQSQNTQHIIQFQCQPINRIANNPLFSVQPFIKILAFKCELLKTDEITCMPTRNVYAPKPIVAGKQHKIFYPGRSDKFSIFLCLSFMFVQIYNLHELYVYRIQYNEIQLERKGNIPHVLCFKLNSKTRHNHYRLCIIKA